MIDLSKLGGGAPAPSFGPSAPATPGGLSLPDFQAPPVQNEHPGDMPWDSIGRALFGTQQEGGSFLGQIPVVGDVARGIGSVVHGVAQAGGVGIGALTGAAGTVLGHIPLNALDQVRTPVDVAKYAGTPTDAVRLIMDVKSKGNLTEQFKMLGDWQAINDPEAYTAWKDTLTKAQGDALGSGDIMSGYVRQWGATYADLTPDGVTGLLDVAPELSFTNGGTLGGVVGDALTQLMVLQRHAEVGAATLKQNAFLVDPLHADTVQSAGKTRLQGIFDTPEADRTSIESQVVAGMQNLGWTQKHALNYLVSHGQGYSHSAVTELALGAAIDPLTVAGLGAAGVAAVGERAALYANTAESASRFTQAYQAGARAIGTTVAAVRDSSLGPAFKVARTIIDPLSSLGGGAHGQAKADVFAAAGISATEKAFGAGAVSSVQRLAGKWGAREVFDNAYAVTATNFARKWIATEHVGNLLKGGDITARRVIPEELIQALGEHAPKDAVSKMAGYVAAHKQFFLNSVGRDQLAERIAKMVKQPLEAVAPEVARMSDDERALWHATTYSSAWSDYKNAVAAVPAEAWGKLEPKLGDMVLLNPNQLDNLAAQSLLAELQAAKGAARARIWNEAAARYSVIEDIGKVSLSASKAMEAKLSSLDRMVQNGDLHTALDFRQMKELPQQFRDEFLNNWVDTKGEPMWRLGFKPNAEQATGLAYAADGSLIQRFEPNIENVAAASPNMKGRTAPVSDALGRILPDGAKDSRVGQAAAGLRDGLDVMLKTAGDNVSGERLMLSMEQSFRKQMRTAGFSDAVAKDVFKVSRKVAQDANITIAGMSPTDFWRANEATLTHLTDAEFAKRDVFGMLMKSAGGDLRLVGLSSGMTQRIRAGLTARGLNPDNYLGQVTVALYQKLRYALNPMFFLQAVSDGPFFNMYRGIIPVGGKVAEEGTALFEMQQLSKALGHSSMARDLSMDYTERLSTIGWQELAQSRLGEMPGVKEGIATRLKSWTGRMILNNEMAFINSEVGNVVHDALATTRQVLDGEAKAATDPIMRDLWAKELDQVPMFNAIRDQMTESLGRVPTEEEVGRGYLSEMVEDSRLEVRTKDGLLNYQRVNAKGEYHKPTNIGELKPLDLNYLAEAVAWPNVHSAADLRAALADSSEHGRTVAELKDAMSQLGMHSDHITRATNALTFNWRHFFDDFRRQVGMSRYEMQGIEDMVTKTAKMAGMSNVDYLTQVMPMATKSAEGLTGDMKFTLDVMRQAKRGEAGIEQMTKLVTAHLQPSMRQTLLDHFGEAITGKNGLIERAAATGDTQAMQDLNLVSEQLRGGWSDVADKKFQDLVVRRAGGEAIANPEVERAVRYFSKWMQEVGPSIQAGEVLKNIVANIPVEGASAHNFTQAILMDTLAQNFRLAEKDAIRLAHMGTERTVLDRSLNHPFFAMYPTSYFYGKVIPETIRFIAKEPFGIKTGVGAETYLKVRQSVEMQSQYDDRMQALWKAFGKSAVVGLLSYLSPSMPWEDMAANLPPWVRSLGKNGPDLSKMTTAEFQTISPERWVSRFFNAGKEIGGSLGDIKSSDPSFTAPTGQASVPTLTTAQAQGLTGISQTQPPAAAQGSSQPITGPSKGAGLAPVLADQMSQLQDVLRQQ